MKFSNIAAIIAFFASAIPCSAATIIPILDGVTEGNANNGIPFRCTVNCSPYQQIWDGSLFGNEPIYLNSISFRNDVIDGAAFGPIGLDAVFSLSSTDKMVDGLSTLAGENIGDDVVVVATNPTIAGSFGGNPNQFDINIIFGTPFLFDPLSGKNLLLEAVFFSIPDSIPRFFDAENSESDGTSRYWGSSGGLTDTLGLVVSFDGTVVPLPAGLPLLATSLILLGFLRRRLVFK